MSPSVRTIGLLVSLLAIPAVGLDAQQDTTRTSRRATPAPADSAAGRDATRERVYRIHPRDLIGADSGVCDDLCRRERMMDSLYGKDRERLPKAAGARARPDSTVRKP